MAAELELGRPTDRKPPFKYASLTRVGFSDTDAQGVVYYGRYLPFFDQARVEYHRHLAVGGARLDNAEFVMRANVVEYFAPAAFDDLLEIFVRARRFGTTSMTWECHAYRVADDLLMVTALQTVVLVDVSTRRPTPIPESYRAPIGEFEGADLEVAAST